MSGSEVNDLQNAPRAKHGRRLSTLALLLPLSACYQPQSLDARSVLADVENEQRAFRIARASVPTPVTGGATVAADPGQGMTEDEAVALALKLNPDLRAARRRIGIAEGQVVAAGALKNPTVDFDWLHLEEISKYRSYAVTLGWEPPQPGVRSERKAAAVSQVDAAKQDLAEAEWQTAMNVRAAHTNLRAAVEDRALIESALATRKRITELVQKRMTGGASTRIDLIVAQLAISDTEYDRDTLAARELEAGRLLGQLIGTTEPIRAAGAVVEEPRSPPAFEKLIDAAMVTRPALVAEQARFEQNEHTLAMEHALAWPWFKFTAMPRYRLDPSQDLPNGFSAGISLTVPLLDQNQGPIRVAEGTRDQEREVFRKVAASIHLEIQTALDKIAFQRKTLDRYRAVVLPDLGTHEKLLATAAAGGQLDVVAVLRAEDAILKARREYVALRLAHRQAWMDLERAVGLRIAGEGPEAPASPAPSSPPPAATTPAAPAGP
ncbi:MAG TPA: TolC family protein [Polyangia bacterium]|nr:TolC family protein [Polyangia bacterium]